MQNCSACSSVKAQKNFVQKSNGKYRKHRSESAHFRRKWRKHWVSNMTRHCYFPCASLQTVNRYQPNFPINPGSSGRKRNVARPVVESSGLWGVMCQSSWSLSAVPLRLSKYNTRNWPVAGATILCRYRCLQTHYTQLCRIGTSGPCSHREICRPSAVIPRVRNITSPGRGAKACHAGSVPLRTAGAAI